MADRCKPIESPRADDATDRDAEGSVGAGTAGSGLVDADLLTLRRAIENSPSAVIITSRTGEIEYVNPRVSEVTGYTVEECVGRNPRFFQSGLHTAEFYRQLWQTLSAGKVWRGEICNRKKDGALYWESASIAPVKNHEGDITHFVAVKEDITERRRIEQALRDDERRANMAMDLSLLVHWELDVSARVYTFDDRFYALYGTSADREGGKQMSVAEYARRFLFPEDQRLVEEELQRALADANPEDVRRTEHRFLRGDGEERYIAVCYRVQRDDQGKIVRVYGANQDITERRRAERQLADAKARAEAINRELEQSLARERDLERMKEQLVGLLVHDLKSPLGAVLINASYLGSDECTEEERSGLIDEVLAATQTMRRMVMDMLDVMRVDGTRLVPKRRAVGIASLLRDAAKAALAQARVSKHHVEIEVPPESATASIDPDLCRRVIENLLDNALKYAPEGTGITLRAEVDGGEVRFEVLDEGPGIPEAERERIFEPYARLERDQGHSGRQSRGLGLSFCKLAVEAHGGQVSVRERAPTGAAFLVRIPAEA